MQMIVLCLICTFMNINENVKTIVKNHKKHNAMHLFTQSVVPFDKSFYNGGREIVRPYLHT